MLDIPIQLAAAHDKLDDYDFLFLESLCRPCSAGAFCSLEPRRQWVGCEWFLSIKINHKKCFYVKATLAACHASDSRRHAKKVQGVRFCASPGPYIDGHAMTMTPLNERPARLASINRDNLHIQVPSTFKEFCSDLFADESIEQCSKPPLVDFWGWFLLGMVIIQLESLWTGA